MQVCTSLQTDNHASTPPLSSLQAGCPSCRPTNSVKALKAPDMQQSIDISCLLGPQQQTSGRMGQTDRQTDGQRDAQTLFHFAYYACSAKKLLQY